MTSTCKEAIDIATVLSLKMKNVTFELKRHADLLGYSEHFNVFITQIVPGKKDSHHIMINCDKSSSWGVLSWLSEDDHENYHEVQFNDSKKMMTYLFHMLKAYEAMQ